MNSEPCLSPSKPLYLISDGQPLRLEAKLVTTVEKVLEAASGKVVAIQLREQHPSAEKPASDIELKELINELSPLCKEQKTKLIINRNTAFIADSRVDGLHMGTTTRKPLTESRDSQNKLLLGYSVHSFSELETAQSLGFDYALVSPLFSPGSKTGPVSLLDREEYKKILETTSIPCFALGGINEKTLVECYHSKLSGFAVISSILWAKNPSDATKKLLACWAEMRSSNRCS